VFEEPHHFNAAPSTAQGRENDAAPRPDPARTHHFQWLILSKIQTFLHFDIGSGSIKENDAAHYGSGFPTLV
jgi:hypothetical protein